MTSELRERVLCICNGGNVRSQQMARMLKKQGYETLNCAWKPKFISDFTLAMLCEWASTIFVAEAWMREKLPNRFWPKVDLSLCVGRDVWGYPTNPGLVAKLHLLIAQYQNRCGRDYVAWEDNGDEVGEGGQQHVEGVLGS